MFEILLRQKMISAEAWQEFFRQLLEKRWCAKLHISLEKRKLRFFISTRFHLSPALANLPEFYFRKSNFTPEKLTPLLPGFKSYVNFLDVFEEKTKTITFTINKTPSGHIVFFKKNRKAHLLSLSNLSKFLELDLVKNPHLLIEKSPKFFKTNKIQKCLVEKSETSVLKAKEGELPLDSYDFNAHQMIIGGSGSGKSKFIAKIVEQLQKIDKQKVVIIDPHDNLKYDIGTMSNTKVFRFTEAKNSFNLVFGSSENIIATTDLSLELFKTLLAEQYNSKLERVLRFSIYLLLENNSFKFQSLQQLLTDSEYRSKIVNKLSAYLPDTVLKFFLTDFNELRTKSYNEAIAPILALIDELAILPVFSSSDIAESLNYNLHHNFQTVISLNSNKLGDRALKMIAGLSIGQIFMLAQKNKEPLILIIDEVAVVENPIIARLLSEGRKFGITVILISQYFNQINHDLKQAIFANTSNYFAFRISREDAKILAPYLNIKSDEMTEADVIDKLSALKKRQLLARVSVGGTPSEGFLAKTLDYLPAKTYHEPIFSLTNNLRKGMTEFQAIFNIDGEVNITEIMNFLSSHRLRTKKFEEVKI
ncbi:MAG: type IV secretion system DNA-binding domain-containing protein [Pseudomonadales bacterium]|jgi:hypothetical protein|nr:type IV secretion system DNA-binding domain-containing protein [Pseudomonadales bacterium]